MKIKKQESGYVVIIVNSNFKVSKVKSARQKDIYICPLWTEIYVKSWSKALAVVRELS